MATILALTQLIDDVKALLEDEESTVNIVRGWKEPAKQINQGLGRANRMVFVPGENGKLGDDLPPRNPGDNPRPIADLDELFTVYLWAYDGTAPEDQWKQYCAARLLYDIWRRAIHLVAYGTITIRSAEWIQPDQERRFGAEIQVVCSVRAPVPDLPAGEVLAEAKTTFTFTLPEATGEDEES